MKERILAYLQIWNEVCFMTQQSILSTFVMDSYKILLYNN